ncbi:hypothetical protein [Spirosoma luteum]|uniref:hypothetical protein n=1 Tax=Spirosoma luteum TaxID=431553 RepID=UPI000362508F|nr:hypothetical protein [Spirosoma luteum]
MKNLLYILFGLLTACESITPIKPGVNQAPIQEEELPHKIYQNAGNVCSAADGGLTTVLLRIASNYGPGTTNYSSPAASRFEVAVIKTDRQGKLLWKKMAWSGPSSSSSRPLIHPLSDGGYFVLVLVRQNLNERNYPEMLLIHISSTGEVINRQSVEGLKQDDSFKAVGIYSLPDKGFIISGYTSTAAGPAPVLTRFDAQGHLQWQQTYGPIANTYDLAATSDGGFMLSWANYISAQNNESLFLKISANGEQEWLKKYGYFIASPVLSETNDKGFVLFGRFTGNSANTVLYKLTKDGHIEWVKLYPLPTGQFSTPLGVFPSGSDYVLVHATNDSVELLTTTLTGDEQSRRSVSGSLTKENGDLIRLLDGSFVLVGPSSSGGFSLTKTNPDKTLHWRSPIATNN